MSTRIRLGDIFTRLTVVEFAHKRGYAWGLSRDDVLAIIGRPCHYCGGAPANVKTTKNTITPLVYSGIDRQDNTIGYEPGNCVPCCKVCNSAKRDMTLAEFAMWASRVAAMAQQWTGPATERAA